MVRAAIGILVFVLLIGGCSSTTNGAPLRAAPTASAPLPSTSAPGSTGSSSAGSPSPSPSSSPAAVPDSQFITAAELGKGYKVMPPAPHSTTPSGFSIGCLDPTRVDKSLKNFKGKGQAATGNRNYQVPREPEIFVEFVADLTTASDAATITNALIKQLAACKRPQARLLGLTFSISSNKGSRGVIGCDDGAVYTASFIHRGTSADKVLYIEIDSIAARVGNKLAYAISLSPLGATGPVAATSRAIAMCNHLHG